MNNKINKIIDIDFQYVENFLKEKKNLLNEIELDQSDFQKLTYFKVYDQNNDFLKSFTKEKIKEYSNRNLKQIYNFYLRNFFNHIKSEQLHVLKKYDYVKNRNRTYFIKVLDLDFNIDHILQLLLRSEKLIDFNSSDISRLNSYGSINTGINFFSFNL